MKKIEKLTDLHPRTNNGTRKSSTSLMLNSYENFTTYSLDLDIDGMDKLFPEYREKKRLRKHVAKILTLTVLQKRKKVIQLLATKFIFFLLQLQTIFYL